MIFVKYFRDPAMYLPPPSPKKISKILSGILLLKEFTRLLTVHIFIGSVYTPRNV